MSTLVNWFFYDLLIQIESQKFQLDWSKDGKPRGMFYVPKESLLLGGSFYRHRTMNKWFFKKPTWITKDDKAIGFYKVFRVTAFIQVSLFVSLIVFFIVIFFNQP